MRMFEDFHVHADGTQVMYAYIMSHRTQITLTDSQYALLRQESERSGLGLAELVRRALAHTYGSVDRSDAADVLEASFATWQGREEDGAAYVDCMRPGLAKRLDR
jgi:hypothetical protein